MTNADIAALILRVAIGLCIFLHGANKWRGPESRRGTAGWFGSIGMRRPTLQAAAAAFTEMVGGVFLLAGFVVPTAAGAVGSTMIVAIVVAHRSNGFFIFNDGQGWEYCAILLTACVAIGALGGGRASLDHALGWDYSGNMGIVTTLVIVLVAPSIHLAASYRPNKS